jgi:uncharacterized membrane protein
MQTIQVVGICIIVVCSILLPVTFMAPKKKDK